MERNCKWCYSKNISSLYVEHGRVRTKIRAKYSGGSSDIDVIFCFDCGKITPQGENYYKPKEKT